MADNLRETERGKGIDIQGGPVIDPTKNVLDLVAAAMLRQDDLREAGAKIHAAEVVGLEKLMQTEIEAIKREFALIENRRQEQKVDTKVAVDAALAAAKDAVKEQAAASEKAILKSETAAGEQSRQNAVTFGAQMQNVTNTVNDLKERVSKLETVRTSGMESKVDQRGSVGMIVGVLGAVFGLLFAIIAIIQLIGS